MSVVAYQNIIDQLFSVYKDKGYISTDTVFEALIGLNIPLYDIDHICEQLLSMGAIVHDDPSAYVDDEGEGEYDRSQINYEQLYAEVISIDKSITFFIEQIKQIQPPQHREWQRLIPQAQNGNDYAYNRLVEMYMRTVVKIALSFYKRFRFPLADTIQEGCVGLITAVDKYEIGRQSVFPTYFPWWVRQIILRNMPFPINPTIYFPVHVKDKLFSIWEIVDDHKYDVFDKDNTCPDLVTKVSNAMGCSADSAIEYIGYYEEFLSINELHNKALSSLSDNGSFMESFLETYHRAEMKTAVEKVISTLSPKEKQILQLRFGFNGKDENTLEQIGSVFKVTRERIRQIEAKAIRKLQHPTRSQRLKAFWTGRI